MTVDELRKEDTLILTVNGKLDVHSSDDFTKILLRSFQKTKNLVVDMAHVEYVSSAGLRAFMLGQKTAMGKGASFSLVNVPDTVKEIFHVTGFDKLLNY